MISSLQQTLFTNWYTRRWVALGLGLFFAIQSLWYWELAPALVGVFFLYQAVTNRGCFGAGACGVSFNNTEAEHRELTEINDN